MAADSRTRACCSARCRSWSSPKLSNRYISLNIDTPPSGGLEAAKRLVDVDLSSRDLLHELDTRGGGGGGPLDPDLREQRVEARPRSRIADSEVPLELLHVSARGEEDPQDLAVLVGQCAELAADEIAGKLRAAGRARQPGEAQALAA